MKPELFSLLPLMALAAPAIAQASKKGISATVDTYVDLDRRASFLHVVPIPLERIFLASNGLPAISGTSPVKSWDQVGLSRHVFFSTGDSAREIITHYDEGRYFAYRVSEFTLSAKYVAKYAIGQWWWTEENGRTKIVWRYTFVPKNFLVRPFLALFVRTRWRPYMQAAMQRVQQDADQRLTTPR